MKFKKHYWTIIRAIGYIIIGLFNTVFLRKADIGTWKNYIGFAFLIAAIIDIVILCAQLKKGAIK